MTADLTPTTTTGGRACPPVPGLPPTLYRWRAHYDPATTALVVVVETIDTASNRWSEIDRAELPARDVPHVVRYTHDVSVVILTPTDETSVALYAEEIIDRDIANLSVEARS